MLVIRPIAQHDLTALLDLAQLTGFGLTTLPRDADLLRERIVESEESFRRMAQRPRGECYLFVMEDLATHAIVGTCGIASKVGGFEPFYAYRLETQVVESEMLGVRKEIQTLNLVTEHNGPCEIGSLFLRPEYRRDGNGKLLSLSRFLFMAEHRQRFDPAVIAEMRGVIDDRGASPFWDALGKHFFEIDFPRADYLSMVNKKFIADLMPRNPIYVPLLPPEAQAVIGQVHPETRPALKMLQDEGFMGSGMVDIFEAGPVVLAKRDEIRTVRESRRGVVQEIIRGTLATDCKPALIMNPRVDSRTCRSSIDVLASGDVRLDEATAAALEVRLGDPVRHAALGPRSPLPGDLP